MEAFVYCWTDHLTNKLYVGSHKGQIDDGYICSSKSMLEQYAIRPQDFTRQIVGEGVFRDIRKLEEVILRTVNAAKDPHYYNLHNNDCRFYITHMSESSKLKLSRRNKGKKLSDETKAKMRKANLGKKLSEEHKLKIGLAHKGRIRKPRTEETKRKICLYRQGKHHSSETKQKISKAVGRFRRMNGSENNPVS